MLKTKTAIVAHELNTSNAQPANKVVASTSTNQIVNTTVGDAIFLTAQAKMSSSGDLFIVSDIRQLILAQALISRKSQYLIHRFYTQYATKVQQEKNSLNGQKEEEKLNKKATCLSFALALTFLVFSSTTSGLSNTSVTLASSGSIIAGARYTVSTLAQLNTVMSQVVAGDLVYIRGGTYQPTSRLTFTRSGTSGSPITFAAYPGETVIFDGTLYAPPSGSFWALVMLNGNWITLSNIKVTNALAGQSAGNAGVEVWGSDCVLDHCEMYKNAGMGACSYGARTKFLYCIAHDNVDNGPNQANGGNADGLGVQGGGTDAYFLGCVTYANSDDGIDNLDGHGATVEKCLSYANGLLGGDGVGFKVGVNQITRKCVAFNNNLEGFSVALPDTNRDGSDTFDHCTAYNNGIATSSKAASGKPGFISQGSDCVFTNNIGTVWYSPVPTHTDNTWDLGITNYGFVSTNPSSADFLSLSATSLCRAKATDGSALGALQYGEKISDLLMQ